MPPISPTNRMGRTKERRWLTFNTTLLLGLSLYLLVSCMGGEGDTATNNVPIITPKPLVTNYMTLYLEDGGPATNVDVALIPIDRLPLFNGTEPFKTRTNSVGRFSTLTLSPGYYNLFAFRNQDSISLGVFKSSVKIEEYTNYILGDTLRPTGGIVGWIRNLEKHKPNDFMVMIKGSTVVAPIDSSGKFILSHLPRGNYTVVAGGGDPDYLPIPCGQAEC